MLDQQVYGYELGTVLSDLIAECEKTGDYVINVVEARLGAARNAIRYQGLQIDTDARRVSVDGVIVPFTKPEYDLLKLLMENPGVSYSREQLTAAVWPDDTLATSRTVDACMTRLRRKIGSYADHIGFSDDGFMFQEDSNRMA